MPEPNQNPPRLSPEEFRAKYQQVFDAGWRIGKNHKGEDALIRDYIAPDMGKAMDWGRRLVTEEADPLGHHPDFRFHGYTGIQIIVSSHFAKGLTEVDPKLTKRVDSFYQRTREEYGIESK